LVFLDESGITTAMTRRYARARRGERAHGSAPGGWRRLTVLGALSEAGMYQMTIAKLPLAKDLDGFTFAETPINESLVRSLAIGPSLPSSAMPSWLAEPAPANRISPWQSRVPASAAVQEAAAISSSTW
jgi:hypothetical protein